MSGVWCVSGCVYVGGKVGTRVCDKQLVRDNYS